MGFVQNNYCTTDYCTYSYCVPTGYNAMLAQVLLSAPGDSALGIQVRFLAYNTNLLRILWEIKSDGIEDDNFTSSSNASDDKAVVNVKDDTIEKYWQANGCASEWIQWDAGLGNTISLDTFALIGHNLTSSAVVRLYGYGTGDDNAPSDWTPVPLYATMVMSDDPNETNLIWVSDAIPADTFRHWRLTIEDSTNPDHVVRVGRVVAGSSLIFVGENALDDVEMTENNFKDEQQLTAFQRIANNRALKKSMTLRFRNLNRLGNSNYRLLKSYLKYCRDTLKALVILDPSDEASKYQFTTFAKLKQMPREAHKYVDDESSYTTLDLEFDEGR